MPWPFWPVLAEPSQCQAPLALAAPLLSQAAASWATESTASSSPVPVSQVAPSPASSLAVPLAVTQAPLEVAQESVQVKIQAAAAQVVAAAGGFKETWEGLGFEGVTFRGLGV